MRATSPTGSAVALLVAVAAAACWGAANVVTRAARPPRPLSLLIYSSLVAPLPLVGLSLLIEGPKADVAALGHVLDGRVILSTASVVVLATLVGFGAWYWLLGKYPSSSVAPFSLLVPVSGLSMAWLLLGEVPTAAQVLGSAVAVAGVGLVVGGGRSHGGRARQPVTRPEPDSGCAGTERPARPLRSPHA